MARVAFIQSGWSSSSSQDLITNILAKFHHEVVDVMGNARPARLEGIEPDVIFLEAPGSWEEVLNEIKRSATFCQTPVVVLWERADDKQRASALEAGAAKCLSIFTPPALHWAVIEHIPRDRGGFPPRST